MPITTRTFRVFVSSTFEDLKAERDALQHDVFPRLRKLCEENGARFQAIDLRWGVRDEAALDQQTMEICLREIERCQQTGIKPNFIVLLGDRYGWRPLPARIEAGEFERILSVASEDERRLLLCEENQPAAGEGWYCKDDNAAPAEYILRPRALSVAAVAPEEEKLAARLREAGAWKAAEDALRKIFCSAIERLGWPADDPRRTKYEASATHQEILKGLGQSEEDRKHVFAFLRTPAPGAEEDPDLAALTNDLRQKLPVGNIRPFSASRLARLCADVRRQLRRVIKAETGKFTSRPALDLEMEAHETFALDRARHFTGRQSVLDMIGDHIRGGESRPLVVHGASGCGKSAIMARAAKLATEAMPDAVFIQRFIGVTPDASSGITLLSSLCQQLSRAYGVTEETPMGFQPLVEAFLERLARATAERPLVLFLDALDQLRSDDEARSFTWLHQNLPPNVSLIVSTTEIPFGLTSAAQVLVEEFPAEEAEELLSAWLKDAKRGLQTEQREKVLSGFAQSKLPLYLKLAFEEARRWRSFQSAESCVLGYDVGSMIDVLFKRLSEEANHGPILVNRSLGFLAAARYGLTEDEMLEVLAADDPVWQDFESRAHHKPPSRQLPVIVWSRLFLDLEAYLNERAAPGGTVIAFYHRQLAERVEAKILAGDEAQARHGDLARHFGARPAWLDERRKAPNARRAIELVFQQRQAQQWTEGEATLFDSQFLFAKVAAGMILDLDADYEGLLREAPESSLPRREVLRLIHGALRLSMHVVAQDAAQFASQMVGRMLVLREEPGVAQFADEITAAAPRPWFRPLHPCLDAPGGALLRTLEGHSDSVRGVSMTPDGRRAVSASDDKSLKVWDLETGRELRTLEGHSSPVYGAAVSPDGRRAISASEDCTLKVWDLETGRELRTLEGHSASVDGVAMSPDGRRAVSASVDKTLKVWDLETGRELRTLEGHSQMVCGVAVSPDGRRAVSASADKTLKVWDLETGRELRTLEGHSDSVNGVSVTPDGRRAVSASADKTLKVWDLETGRELLTLEGHSSVVDGVAMSSDGRRALSFSWDHTLKEWDLETGRELRTLEGHSDVVRGVAVSPDGRRAVSASDDKSLKVWDLETGRELHTLEGHSDSVNGVSVTPDGRRAVSASEDHTLKVWDLETGRELRTLEGHSKSVYGVSVTPDGRRAVSASEDHTLREWDLETGRELRILEGHGCMVCCVAVSPDGRRAVSAGCPRWSMASALKVWDLETGRELRTLEGHSRYVLGVAVTPDGRRAVSASLDKMLRVWDLESGVCLRTLEGHSDCVRSVSVAPDGRRAASASDDHKVNVWDLKTGAPLATFTCDGPAWSCAFTTDRKLIAGDAFGRVHFLCLEE